MEIPGEKLVIRLWDTIEKLGSGIFSPSHIRRTGRAHNEIAAERIVYIAQAERLAEQIKRGDVNVLSTSGQPLLWNSNKSENSEDVLSTVQPAVTSDIDYAQIAFNSAAVDQLRKDINVAKAIHCAEKELESDTSDEPKQSVNEDWLHRWREGAASTSNENMQQIWGRLLAGEIKSPGSFSLRTFDTIKNLSHSEALEIQGMAPFVLSENFIFREESTPQTTDTISFPQLVRLAELGVVSGVEAIGMSMQFESLEPEKFFTAWTCHNKVLIVEGTKLTDPLKIPAYCVTHLGREILKLCTTKANEAYLHRLGQHLAVRGFKITLADIISVNKGTGSIEFNNERIIL